MSEQILHLKPKNWQEHQHYKDRLPPWIKLHRALLNDKQFMRLPIASKALAPLLWLLASESTDGVFNASTDELEFRLRMTAKDISAGLKPLIDIGFFHVASGLLADGLHVAAPEESRGETEKEKESETKVETKVEEPKGSTRPLKKCPADFVVTEEMSDWAKTDCPLIDMKLETDSFKDYTFSTAKTDWLGTWRNWMRKANKFAAEKKAPKGKFGAPKVYHELATMDYSQGVSDDGSF